MLSPALRLFVIHTDVGSSHRGAATRCRRQSKRA